MCPLDPKYLARITGGLRIEDDRYCTKCGYNLVGLKTSQKCPECGRPIDEATFGRPEPERKLLIVRDPGPFGATSVRYQRALASRATGLGMAGVAMMVLLPPALLKPSPVTAGFALAATIAWFIGSWRITGPREVARGSKVDPAREGVGLRAWARTLQVLWVFVAAQVLLAVIPAAPLAGSSTRFITMAWFTVPAAMAGLFPLVWHVSGLGFWVGDTSLAFFMRSMTWAAIPGSVVAMAMTFTRALPHALTEWGLSTVAVANPVTTPGEGMEMWMLLAAVAHLAGLVPLPLLAIASFDLVLMGRWIRQAIRERGLESPLPARPLAPIETPEIELAETGGEAPKIRSLQERKIAPPKKQPPTRFEGL